MPHKIKTIVLETFEKADNDTNAPPPYKLVRVWRIKKVTDSTEYTPGELMFKPGVEELCSSPHWKVTIVVAE